MTKITTVVQGRAAAVQSYLLELSNFDSDQETEGQGLEKIKL